MGFELISVKDYVFTAGDLLLILGILVITKIVIALTRKLIFKKWKSKKADLGKRHSLFNILRYLLWVIAISIALESAGVNLTILIASSAALFIGIGFGLQEVFRDFTSGIILLFEGTLEVGDVVEVDGLIGRVIVINLRTTKIITRDQIVIIVPNHKFISDRVINWSHNYSDTRFSVDVGVAYGSDTNQVRKALIQCCEDMAEIKKDPPPFVRFSDFGDSSLDFQLFFWSERIFSIENIKSELRYRIDQTFREEGIQIPFPQRDLHIKSGSASKGL